MMAKMMPDPPRWLMRLAMLVLVAYVVVIVMLMPAWVKGWWPR